MSHKSEFNIENLAICCSTRYQAPLTPLPQPPRPQTPLRTLSFAELQGIPGLATIKTVVNLKPLQSRALVCQTMMTQCPVRPVMTEIYALLLESGPSALPSETPFFSPAGSGKRRRRRRRSEAEQQITANALNHRPKRKITVLV